MKKICIVEDEAALAEMYTAKFKAEGFAVKAALNGAEGLKLIKEFKPDLVLLDLIMPRMDGFQVLQELKADPATKDLQVYIFSNLGQSAEVEKGLKEGANGYFIKSSLTPSQLAEKVKKILS